MRLTSAFFIIGILFDVAGGARILVVFPMGAHSHFILGLKLGKELADRGHNVTFINAFPQKTPIKNLREISVAEIIGDLNGMKQKLYEIGTLSYISQLAWAHYMGVVYTEGTLKVKEVKELLRSDEKFDIIVQEHFINEALMIFAHKFDCPLVLVAAGPTTMLSNYLFTNPSPSSYIPNFLSNFGSHMTFWERLVNFCYDMVGELYIYNFMLPAQNTILERNVPGAPNLEQILYNASLLLLNSHTSLKEPVPLQPAIKEVGGYHIGPLKPLPEELQEFLDGAKEGAIIFSMGSNLECADFPHEKRDVIIRVFSRLKQRILWKFEGDLPVKPNNVKVMKWIPQQDALAHPNVVAFITHVGLLSTTEAIYHGVPLLGLPVYWDQDQNIEDAVNKGFALRIPFPEVNEDNFERALNEILSNPKYRENVKLHSKIMHDRPIKPLDEAMYWIEYVLRFNGAAHLRSAGLDIKWYQRYQVDIALALVLIVFILFAIVLYICKNLVASKKVKRKND